MFFLSIVTFFIFQMHNLQSIHEFHCVIFSFSHLLMMIFKVIDSTLQMNKENLISYIRKPIIHKKIGKLMQCIVDQMYEYKVLSNSTHRSCWLLETKE